MTVIYFVLVSILLTRSHIAYQQLETEKTAKNPSKPKISHVFDRKNTLNVRQITHTSCNVLEMSLPAQKVVVNHTTGTCLSADLGSQRSERRAALAASPRSCDDRAGAVIMCHWSFVWYILWLNHCTGPVHRHNSSFY